MDRASGGGEGSRLHRVRVGLCDQNLNKVPSNLHKGASPSNEHHHASEKSTFYGRAALMGRPLHGHDHEWIVVAVIDINGRKTQPL